MTRQPDRPASGTARRPAITGDWLSGRTALVTGGSRGLGLGVVEALIEADATVIVNALDPARLGALQNRYGTRPGKVHILPADVASWDGARCAVEAALAMTGQVDILVNTVGDAIPGPIVDDEEIAAGRARAAYPVAEILDLNMMSAIYCTRAIAPHMIARGRGRIISLTAVYGLLRGRDNLSLYAAGKSGLAGFMKSAACEFAPHGITVNMIAPGLLPDPGNFSDDFIAKLKSRYEPLIPMGRFGDLREIGGLAVFLASDHAAYLTGQTIALDGGLSI